MVLSTIFTFFDYLTLPEGIVLGLLCYVVCFEIYKSIKSKFWYDLYKPTIFLSILILFYCIVGPIYNIIDQEGILDYREVNHKSYIIYGWIAALLFYVFNLIGFYSFPNQLRRKANQIFKPKLNSKIKYKQYKLIYLWGLRLCQVALISTFLLSGLLLFRYFNPFTAYAALSVQFDGTDFASQNFSGYRFGFLTGYVNYFRNFLIPGLLLMFTAFFNKRGKSFSVITFLILTIGFYISLGFRYRLILLILPILLVRFLILKKRPRIGILIITLIIALGLNGFLQITRKYSSGLDFSEAENKGTREIIRNSLFESNVFLSSSAIISNSPKIYPYVGAKPFINAVLFPIPRNFLADKPEGEYLFQSLETFYGKIGAAGAFVLCIAEYYLIGGWISLIVLSFISGLLFRRLWNWYLLNKNDVFAQSLYASNLIYIYLWFSRGYFSQILLLFVFSVAPLWLLYRRWKKIFYG